MPDPPIVIPVGGASSVLLLDLVVRVTVAVASLVAIAVGTFAGTEYRPLLSVPLILLAAAPSWVILWLTHPRRGRDPGRLLRWLGCDVWALVPPEMALQLQKIEARETERAHADHRPTVGAGR